jgi:stage V sporulation protein AC
MNAPDKAYLDYVKKTMPKTKQLSTIARAFLVGGLICCLGQALFDIYFLLMPNQPEDVLKNMATTTIILLTAVLTGFGIYDKIGAFGGAGSMVPITGFANAVVSSSIEHKREGVVLGLCADMFKVAGPVIVFGIVASVIVGIIVVIFKGAFL